MPSDERWTPLTGVIFLYAHGLASLKPGRNCTPTVGMIAGRQTIPQLWQACVWWGLVANSPWSTCRTVHSGQYKIIGIGSMSLLLEMGGSGGLRARCVSYRTRSVTSSKPATVGERLAVASEIERMTRQIVGGLAKAHRLDGRRVQNG